MKGNPGFQAGASAVGNVILLAVVLYAVFVGFQFLPLVLESRSLDSMLNSIEDDLRVDPADNVGTVEAVLEKYLYVSELQDMRDKINVRPDDGNFVIEIDYERELNLLFDTRKIEYHKRRKVP